MADEEMEMEGTEGGAEEEKPKKGLPIKLIIIILVAVLMLGGGGFFAYKFFLAGDDEPAKDEKAAEEGADAKGKEAAKPPSFVLDLQPFIVNLADPAGKRYLKLKLAVDAKDEKLKSEIERRMPQIRDSILLLLTSKAYSDISSVAGKIRLRNEILKIFNRSLLGVGAVHSVFFTEFVVQ